MRKEYDFSNSIKNTYATNYGDTVPNYSKFENVFLFKLS